MIESDDKQVVAEREDEWVRQRCGDVTRPFQMSRTDRQSVFLFFLKIRTAKDRSCYLTAGAEYSLT